MKHLRILGALAALTFAALATYAEAAVLKQNADGSLSIMSEITGNEVFRAGGPKATGAPTASVPEFKGGDTIKLGPFAGVAATTGGAIGAWTNNLGYDIIVTGAFFDVTTASGGAANLTVGENSTSVTTAASDIIAAVSVASTGIKAGGLSVKIPAGAFVTLQGSATTVGLVGSLYLRYVAAQ